MVDEIGVAAGALVDRLGDPVRAEARFAATVRDGGLRLRSTAVWLVLGGRRVRIPRRVAPVVVLTERWDDAEERQLVSITVALPVIGRMYQYRGRFRYGDRRSRRAVVVSERIVIAGASGFIGRYLAQHYRAAGAEVVLVGRDGPDVRWDDADGLAQGGHRRGAVINLAGKSVNCRYGDANRAEIFRSRVETTRAVREAIAASDAPPPVWFNASTATIYRHAEDRPMTESTGELGTGFSVEVAKAWEARALRGRPARHPTGRAADGDRARRRQRADPAREPGALRARRSAARRSLVRAPPRAATPAPSTSSAPAAAGSGSAGCTSPTCSARSSSCASIPTSTARSTSPRRIRRTTAP